jgi:hypothetical protein
MPSTLWLILDTETNGLKPPIFVVELAARLQQSLDVGLSLPWSCAVDVALGAALTKEGDPARQEVKFALDVGLDGSPSSI